MTTAIVTEMRRNGNQVGHAASGGQAAPATGGHTTPAAAANTTSATVPTDRVW